MKMNNLHLEQLDERSPKKVVLMLAGIRIAFLTLKIKHGTHISGPKPEESRGGWDTCTFFKRFSVNVM